MKKTILLLFILGTTYVSAQVPEPQITLTTQKCTLVGGSGPFKEFKIYYTVNTSSRNSRLSKIDAVYTSASGRSFENETIKGESLSVKKFLNEDDFPFNMIIDILDVGDWGAGTINIGTDETDEVTALVEFFSDSGTNRGVYRCTDFLIY